MTYGVFGDKELKIYKDPKTDTSHLKKSHRGLVFVEKVDGEYIYKCNVNGDFSWFQGYEEIYWKDTKVYECYFHGGLTRAAS